MVNYNFTGILYSNKNLNLQFQLNSYCRTQNIFLTTATDFIELSIKTVDLKPHIIFIDLETIELLNNVLTVLSERLEFSESVIVLIGDEKKIEKEAIPENFIFINKDKLKDEIDSILYKVDLTKHVSSKISLNIDELENDINRLLFSLGFSSKYIGSIYLFECIKCVVLNNNVIRSLSSNQYVYIASKYKTNVANIERNIRNAISETWKKFGKSWYSILLTKTLEIGLKPSNRELINMCSQILLMNSKYRIKVNG